MAKTGDKNLGKIKGFSIQFIPYSEIRYLSSNERIRKILGIVLGNNILFLQGRLKSEEEARLIGDKQQDSFLNKVNNAVRWKFIDVAEINKLENLTDGAEMYSRIYEEENAELYIRATHSRAQFLLEKGLDQFVPIN